MVLIPRPLYTAPELIKSVSAVVPRAPRQPSIMPSSVAKRKRSPLKAPAAAPGPLNTWPVGDRVPPPAFGKLTTSPCLTPEPLYSVAVPVLLSETQNGVVGPKEIPHGLTSWASVLAAIPEMSEERFDWTNWLMGPA